MANSVKISLRKLQRIEVLSLINSLRLHLDAIHLFRINSLPSAFQLSVLALEEFGKAKALDDFVWNITTHGNKRDYGAQLKYLERLYLHPWKQGAALFRERYNFSAKYLRAIENKELEARKQAAVYVGVRRINGKIDAKGRISDPSCIKEKEVKQQISLLNDIFLEIAAMVDYECETAELLD